MADNIVNSKLASSPTLAGGYQCLLLRPLSQRYLVLYIDATYVPTRRDRSVSQEAYYSILGLLPDGRREVLSVVHHPEEGALCWEMELEALKERGVEAVDLIVSDGLTRIEHAVKGLFQGHYTNSVRCISSAMP